MAERSLSVEMCDLVRRAAAHPHGLGFVHQADLDSVAVILGVHPFVVAEARSLLETPEGRAVLIEEFREARAHLEEEQGSEPASRSRTPEPPPAAKSVRALIREASVHPLGLSFLVEAPFETVALTLRAHPFVVVQARAVLDRRAKRRRNPDPAPGN